MSCFFGVRRLTRRCAEKEINIYVGLSDLQRKWYRSVLEKDIDAVNGLTGKKEGKTRLMNVVMQVCVLSFFLLSARSFGLLGPSEREARRRHFTPSPNLAAGGCSVSLTYCMFTAAKSNMPPVPLRRCGTGSSVYHRRTSHQLVREDGHPRQTPGEDEGEGQSSLDLQSDESAVGYLGGLLLVPRVQ